MQIQILDWQKYNPRTDSKQHTWFRFENLFFSKTFSWGGEVQRLFIYLCCLCSQEKKLTFKLDVELASTLLKRKESQILADLESLSKRNMVTLSNSELLEITSSNIQPMCPTYVRTNDTNVHIVDFDFDQIYNEYPRKEGKKKGIQICRREIKTQDKYDQLILAVRKYSKHVTGKEPQFIKNFSTFMNSWTDWLDPDAGKVKITRPAPKPIPPPAEPEPDYESTPEVREAAAEKIRMALANFGKF